MRVKVYRQSCPCGCNIHSWYVKRGIWTFKWFDAWADAMDYANMLARLP